MNYYNILNIDISASQQDIKTSFRALAKQHHPDRGGNEEEFKLINEAYSVLSDEVKRQQYDYQFEYLHRQRLANIDLYDNITITLRDSYFGLKTKRRIAGRVMDLDIPRGVQSGATITIPGVGDTYAGKIGSLFLKVYVTPDPEVKKLDTLDLEANMNVNFIDVIKGKKQDIQLWGEHICRITIPSGMKTSDRMRIPGKGLSSRYNISGDLYIKLNIQIPEYNNLPENIKETIDKLEEQLNEI